MLVAVLWCCMWGRGWEGACSTLHRIAVTPSAIYNQIGSLWCWFLSGWACSRSWPLWVSPTNSPVRLGVSPAAASTPMGVFNQRFEAFFPWAGVLGCVVCFAPLPLLPIYLCMNVGLQGASCSLACPIHSTICHVSGSGCCNACPLLWLPICTPPTGLDECFFFLSLVVGLLCGSVFCQFWLFFVFILFFFFWLCKEVQCVYLCLHLGFFLPRILFLNLHHQSFETYSFHVNGDFQVIKEITINCLC